MAVSALERLGLDEVRFIPCRISPHKQGSAPAPAGDRLEMLKLATRGLPWAVVDDTETRREGPSYSWQTAEEMAARFPGARLFWIMGVDQWRVLDQWMHPERLAARVEFIVFSRGGAPQPHPGRVLHPLESDHPASATLIRGQIAHGETEHPWLDPQVLGWINHRQLYRPAQ